MTWIVLTQLVVSSFLSLANKATGADFALGAAPAVTLPAVAGAGTADAVFGSTWSEVRVPAPRFKSDALDEAAGTSSTIATCINQLS